MNRVGYYGDECLRENWVIRPRPNVKVDMCVGGRIFCQLVCDEGGYFVERKRNKEWVRRCFRKEVGYALCKVVIKPPFVTGNGQEAKVGK